MEFSGDIHGILANTLQYIQYVAGKAPDIRHGGHDFAGKGGRSRSHV